MIWLTEFWGSGFRCEELILLHFCLQMLNDKILKSNNEICLKCEYQLKQKTTSREKNLQLIVSAEWKMDLSFETLNSTFCA